MLKINNLNAKIQEKSILSGFNLEIKPGEVHARMGPNGSGKSTLSNILSGKKGYEVSGEVLYENKNLFDLETEERAHEGIFLAFQWACFRTKGGIRMSLGESEDTVQKG